MGCVRGFVIILASFVHFSLEIQLAFVLSFQSTTQSRRWAEHFDRRLATETLKGKNRRVTEESTIVSRNCSTLGDIV